MVDVLETIMDYIIGQIELNECSSGGERQQSETETSTCSQTGTTRHMVRRKRSAHELWDIDSANILAKKRVVAASSASDAASARLASLRHSPASAMSSKSSPSPTCSSTSLGSQASAREIKVEETDASTSRQPVRVSARLRRSGITTSDAQSTVCEVKAASIPTLKVK